MTQEVKIIGGITVLTLIIVIGGAILLGNPQAKPDAAKPIKVDTALLLGKESYQTLPKSKITFVEFADFQCPACAAFYPVVTQLKAQYKDKVNFVFRHFPLPQHKHALLAGQVFEAAAAQNKAAEMERVLFTNQKDWSENNNPMELFIGYAKELQLDMDRFTNDIESKKYQSKIMTDASNGSSVGVNSTPSFFLNGEKLQFITSLEQFQKKIDETIASSR